MEFLQARFAFDLTEGKVDTFVADVFQPRPDFENAARYHIWSTDAREKMRHAMQRKNCPVEWAGLVIDQLGLLAIVRFQKRLILGSAKNAASSILQCLPDEQRRAAELGLRPLDEVDKDRISAWQTMADVRPRGFNKRAREETDSEEEAPLPAKRTKTLQALLAEVAEESSEDEGSFAPPRLALTDSAPLAEAERPALRATSELNLRDPTSVWEHRAKREATIVLAEVGERPSSLAYIRCHRENRRTLLLQQRIRAGGTPRRELSLLHVVQIAARLARESIIPNPGKHGRTHEFVERCAAALEVLNPEAPTAIGDQSREDQLAIRRALAIDGEELYLECLASLCTRGEAKTAWVKRAKSAFEDFAISKCSACGTLQAFGRKALPVGRLPRVASALADDALRASRRAVLDPHCRFDTPH